MLSKLFPQNRLIKAEDLMKTWRIIVMVIICQLLGLLVGLVVPLHPEKFLSLWIGGAIGTLPGFIIGTLWYYSSEDRSKGVPYFTLGFFAIGSIILPIVAFGLLASGTKFTNLKLNLQTLQCYYLDAR